MKGPVLGRSCGCDLGRRTRQPSGLTIPCGSTDIEEKRRHNDGPHQHAGTSAGPTGAQDVIHPARARIHQQRVRQSSEKHYRGYGIDKSLDHESKSRARKGLS